MTTRHLISAQAVALLAVALAACSLSPAAAARPDCTTANAITQITGECQRIIDSLTEARTEHIAVKTGDIRPLANVQYEVTVQAGTVIVVFSDVDNSEQSAQASPGQPARGSARIRLDPLNQINFGLAPVDGTATGVSYHITFVCDCMP